MRDVDDDDADMSCSEEVCQSSSSKESDEPRQTRARSRSNAPTWLAESNLEESGDSMTTFRFAPLDDKDEDEEDAGCAGEEV